MTSTKLFASNKELMNYLKECGSIKSDFVFDIMCTVDRKHFINNTITSYTDRPQVVAYDKSISAPHMHARVLEILSDKLRNGGRILDIGSGSGYLTTCMALALGKPGIVIGMDCIPGFYDMANKIIRTHYPKLLYTDTRVQFIVGDGRQGYLTCSPYNIIHVGLAATRVPQILVDQLGPGGSLIMPIGDQNQQVLCLYEKSLTGAVAKKELLPVRYGYFEDVKNTDLLNFKNTVDNENNLSSNHQTFSNYIENFEKVVKNSIEKVEKRIHDFQTDMSGKINSVTSNLNEKYEKANEQIFQRISNIEMSYKKLDSDVNVFKSETQTKLKEYFDQMSEKVEGIEQKITALSDEFQQSNDINREKENQMYTNKLADIEKIHNETSKLFEVYKTESEKTNVKWNEINQQLQNMLNEWDKVYAKNKEEKSCENILQVDDHDTYENLEQKLSFLNEQLIQQNEKIKMHEKILAKQIKIFKREEQCRIAEKKKLEIQRNLEEITETINRLNKEIKVTELENQIRRFTFEKGKDASANYSAMI